MRKILVVGQTPPPYGGQALMIQKMLDGKYGDIQLYHLRMAFSKEMDEIGKFKFSKLFELIRVIAKIIAFRFLKNVRILYYPPGGPRIIPMLRDISILISTRWLFDKTIFHFHAGGVSELYDRLPRFMKFWFRLAYYYPDAAIRTSKLDPGDPKKIIAAREFIVPNGIEDNAKEFVTECRDENKTVCILFVSVLSENKGIGILLGACRTLESRNIKFRINLVGRFETPTFENYVREFVRENDIGRRMTFSGVLIGRQKWEAYAAADIYCFPSHFEAETLSVSLIEALSFGLPVVATRWRASPDIVEDGVCGFLVPVKNREALAARLEQLICDPDLRQRMGQQSRRRFLEKFTLQKYRQGLMDAFNSVVVS